MTNLCISIYRFFRSHKAIYWTSMVALFVFLGYFAFQIHLEEDINKLMPSSKNEDGTTKLAFANLRIKDKTFIVFEGLDRATPEHIAATCDEFIEKLKQADEESDPDNPVIGDMMYTMPEDLLLDVIDYLSERLPSYIDTSVYSQIDTLLTVEHFREQMLANKKDFQSPVGEMFPELIEMDPIGLRSILKDQMSSLTSTGGGSYITLEDHFFTRDSTVCVAFITPMYSATNTGQGSELFRMLNDEIKTFEAAVPDVKISYHGTPASGYYNSWRIKRDLAETVSCSLVLVLIFIFLCFRNYDTLPLLVLPVAFGTLFGLAVMYFLKGQFSLLALGIGAVVLGVAFSYVIHVITHYKYVTDPEQVLRDQVKPVCLGCLTTIGSFMGLLFIRTDLLQDFGLFAALAIAGTTAFSLTYLPMMLDTKKNKHNFGAFKIIDKMNTYPFDRNKPLLAVILIVICVCVGYWATHGILFDANMHNLGYHAKLTTYSEELLRDKTFTGDKQKYFASSGSTMEEAIENFKTLSSTLDSLQEEGIVKSFTRTDEVFIPLRKQQERIDAWQEYWTEERLAKVQSLIDKTAPEAGLRPQAFSLFFDYARCDYEPDALYEADIVPYGYLSTLMEQSYNGEYLCFTSVRCENDVVRGADTDYAKICDAVASKPNLLVLDTYYYTQDTLVQMNSDFDILQWVSMLFVFVVLLLSFRFNLKNAITGFMPILLSWLIVLGAMGIFDMKFNLINIIISTFIFGIGVDYSIFVMNGLTGSDPKLLEYHKTAIFFSAAVLIVSVGSMLFASHPAIKSVGFSTLVGLVSAVVIAYVLQPAVYRLLNKKKQI